MSRLAQPQLSFADLELRNQGVLLDPLMQGILAFLDDHAALVEQVRQDLVRGLRLVEVTDAPLPKTGTGKILKRELRERFWEGAARRVQG